MKKLIKYLLVIILISLSFYITNKSALFVKTKDPILKSIKDYSNSYNVDAVNALIEDSYIIPGIYGKKVNEIKSLMNMKGQKEFNSIFLEIDKIKPEISLSDNKDKIINKGNPSKQAISLIIENDETNAISYIVSNNISASILVTSNSVNHNPKLEQINNDFNNYNNVEKVFNKNNINTNICIINRTNKEFCIRNKKYLVEPSLIFTSSNLLSIKNKLSSGDIILVKDNVSIDDLSYIINYTKTKGLNIIKLSELISEI